jgi:EAL domain-containing protein (putative c-di-GMP-specific phosphodiesterase class I)
VTKLRRLDQPTLPWHPCLEPLAEGPAWVLVLRLDPSGRWASAVGVEAFDALVEMAGGRLAAERGSLAGHRRCDDDLVVPLQEATVDAVLSVAGRYLAALDVPWHIEGRRIPIQAVIGVAPAGRGGDEDMAQALADARAAITAAAAGPGAGTCRIAVADAVFRRSLRRDVDLEAQVELALEGNELDLAFQPIVSTITGRAVGAEALLRWDGAPDGTRSPRGFLDAARRSGAMPAITAWVLETAIATCATWPAPTFVSINLDPSDLTGPAAAMLSEQLIGACRRHRVEPTRVWLEVTEHAVDELEDADTVLGRLASLGARIALDDLGSGCSSLSRLHELPFEVCKVDRSLVQLAARKRPVADLLRALVDHAHGARMTVVAEGVESPAEWWVAAEAGSELVQGFYLHRPLRADAVGALFGPAAETAQVADDAVVRMLPGA